MNVNTFLFSEITEDDVKILKPLEDVYIKSLGHAVTFECQLSRDVSEYAWLKNGKPLLADKHHKITASDGTYKLYIPHSEPEDAAEYTFSCRGNKTSAKLVPKSKRINATQNLNVFIMMQLPTGDLSIFAFVQTC